MHTERALETLFNKKRATMAQKSIFERIFIKNRKKTIYFFKIMSIIVVVNRRTLINVS
jgi:hypothetical protein